MSSVRHPYHQNPTTCRHSTTRNHAARGPPAQRHRRFVSPWPQKPNHMSIVTKSDMSSPASKTHWQCTGRSRDDQSQCSAQRTEHDELPGPATQSSFQGFLANEAAMPLSGTELILRLQASNRNKAKVALQDQPPHCYPVLSRDYVQLRSRWSLKILCHAYVVSAIGKRD